MRHPYYRRDLSLVHHRGFGFHADRCAPGILELLVPVLEREGTVLELGCGSGLLTRHLVEAGHRVIATDASPAMLELASDYVPAAETRLIVLPDEPLPPADAVVAVGHPLNYLSDKPAVERALAAVAAALGSGGVLAIDLSDLEWGSHRRDVPPDGRVGEDWAIISEFSTPSPDRFIRSITAFLRSGDGTWRRDDEVHENVLIDTSEIPAFLSGHGVSAEIARSFGSEQLPVGLVAVVGHRV